MKFNCPNCGTMTSSAFSLEMGGYWELYSKTGPWGCPRCRRQLHYLCPRCTCIYCTNTNGLTCPECGHKARGPVVMLIAAMSLALLILFTCAYLASRWLGGAPVEQPPPAAAAPPAPQSQPKPTQSTPRPAPPNRAPQAEIAGMTPDGLLVGQETTFSLRGSDPDGDPLQYEYRLTATPRPLPAQPAANPDGEMPVASPDTLHSGWTAASGSTFTVTPQPGWARLKVEIRVSDGRGLTSPNLAREYPVRLPNRPPMLTIVRTEPGLSNPDANEPVSITELLEGDVVTIETMVREPDGDRVTLQFRTSPTSAWENAPGTLIRFAGLQPGRWQLEVRALDSQGLSSAVACYPCQVAANAFATWQELASFSHDDGVRDLAFAPDGRTLASISDDGKLRIWRIDDGMCVQRLETRGKPVSIAFGPDKRTIAVGLSGGVDLYAVADQVKFTGVRLPAKSLARVPAREADNRVHSLAFDPDGKTLAGGVQDGIYLWNVGNGKTVRAISTETAWQNRLAFSPDGSMLVRGSGRAAIGIWRVATGELKQVLFAPGGVDVPSVAFSRDGQRVVCCGKDRWVTLFTFGGAENQIEQHLPPILERLEKQTSIVFHPDNQCVACSGVAENDTAGAINLWRMPDGKLFQKLRGHRGAIHRIAFSPDGTILASGGSDGTIRLWGAVRMRQPR